MESLGPRIARSLRRERAHAGDESALLGPADRRTRNAEDLLGDQLRELLAEQASDAISAEDIGKFPDLNISESLQRIPGVTLNRNSFGEGQQINLRGLGFDESAVAAQRLGVEVFEEGARCAVRARFGAGAGVAEEPVQSLFP